MQQLSFYPCLLLYIVVTVFFSNKIHAQETTNPLPDTLQLIPTQQLSDIVISDTRIRSLHNYTSLNSQVIQLQDERHIVQAINTIPGVFMHTGALNTNRITIRGIGNRSPFSTTKIKAYLNDIPLTNGIGETSIEDIDLSIVNKIDVWKGPTASRYGAGLGGMIHLQTTDKNNINSEVSVSSHANFGSYGLRRFVNELYYGDAKKETMSYLNYSLMHSNGYRANNEYDRTAVTFLNQFKVGDGQLSFLLNYTDLKAFIPSSLNATDFIEEPTKAAFTWGKVKGFEDYNKYLVGANYQTNVRESIDFSLSLNMSSRDSYESRPFNILLENSLAFTARATLSTTEQIHDKLKMQVGTEIFGERYNWETYETLEGMLGTALSINKEKRQYQNYFAELGYQFSSQLNAKASINFNNTSYNLADRFTPDSLDLSGIYTFENVLSPRFIISYTPNNKMQVYASASHGFSPPTLEETLTPDGEINPDIQPEKGWSFELGSRGRLLQNKLQYELSLYAMTVNDLLVARRTALDQYVGVNAGQTQHNGLEATLTYDFVKAANQQLSLQASYNYQAYTFTDFVDDDNDYSGNDLTGTSPHLFNLFLLGNYKGFYGNLHYQYVDAMPLRDDNTIYSTANFVVNSKLGYQFNISEAWFLDVYAGMANITNETYAAMYLINASSFGGAAPRYYYPGLPRNFYGGLSIKIKL